MSEFIEVKKSKISTYNRGVVQGVGTNDAWYKTQIKVGSKKYTCPIYRRWSSLLKRCYCSKFHKTHKTYKDCMVCDEWLLFSNFYYWFKENNVKGYELDKDVKIKGNKIYSPETCLIVPKSINMLLNDCESSRGNHPRGVYFDKTRGKYLAAVRIDGKKKNLGRFISQEDASKAYIKAKNAEIIRKCDQYPEFAKYLINHLMEHEQ